MLPESKLILCNIIYLYYPLKFDHNYRSLYYIRYVIYISNKVKSYVKLAIDGFTQF